MKIQWINKLHEINYLEYMDIKYPFSKIVQGKASTGEKLL